MRIFLISIEAPILWVIKTTILATRKHDQIH